MAHKKYGYMNVFGMHWEESDDIDEIIKKARAVANTYERAIPLWQLAALIDPDEVPIELSHFGLPLGFHW